MDHQADRKNDKSHWERSTRAVINPLVDITSLEFGKVDRAVGIVEVNSYEIYNPGDAGFRGVLPVTSLMSHSCAPNVRLALSKEEPFVNKVNICQKVLEFAKQ